MDLFDNRLLEKAEEVATLAHKGQRRFSGEEYITHPEAVAGIAKAWYSSEEKPAFKQRIVAWLHDVIEDTKITAVDMLVDFPRYLVEAVVALSKSGGEPYFIYIKRLCDNKLAMQVKLCDLNHNMRTMPEGENKAWRKVNKLRLEKYQLTKMYVEEKLNAIR